MERKITTFLQKWKKDLLRKPLLIYGSKQVGKTMSVLEFGKKEYRNVLYFNTDNYKELLEVFRREKSVDRIILSLSLLGGETIFPHDTLIILDNVNDVDLVKGIKLFGKEKNDYHIILTTSRRQNLLSFKGEELQYKNMFPMDFEEYLWAMGKKEIADYINTSFGTSRPMAFHSMAEELYLEYLMVGGMPEAVEAKRQGKTVHEISAIHQKILDTYQKEISATNTMIDITRGISVLKCVPYQLLKENRKFQYGLIEPGSRSKEYESAIESLTANQLLYRSYKVSTIKSPLTSCRDKESFKLYLNDNGLLFTMLHASPRALWTDNHLRELLYENATAIALSEAGYSLNYYQSEGKAELSFVIQNRLGQVIPIEIVTKNASKSKSLSLFMSRFTVKEGQRITEENFEIRKGIRYLPIYSLYCFKEGPR